MSALFIVATPIGNLEDVTPRALRVLREVDIIVCEDTRVTKRLLERHGITNKQLTTYNERQSGASIEKIVSFLKEGKSLALVSDAGTPGISDPGSRLVRAARAAGFSVVSVPGPNAAIAALSISGFPASDFLFLGFLPHKKGRETLFKEIAVSERTVVFYESPHRIIKTLSSLQIHLDRHREVFVARELTKMHEEGIVGTAKECLEFFQTHKEKIRGEFVVLVSPEHL